MDCYTSYLVYKFCHNKKGYSSLDWSFTQFFCPSLQNIVADMRKVLAKNPQVEQQKLHRRVFLDNINPENQALMVRSNSWLCSYCLFSLVNSFICKFTFISLWSITFGNKISWREFKNLPSIFIFWTVIIILLPILLIKNKFSCNPYSC